MSSTTPKEIPECPICCSEYNATNRVSMIIQCGHSLCLSCINSLKKKHCPNCKQPIKHTVKNFALMDLVEKCLEKDCGEEIRTTLSMLRDDLKNKHEIYFQKEFKKKCELIQSEYEQLKRALFLEYEMNMQICESLRDANEKSIQKSIQKLDEILTGEDLTLSMGKAKQMCRNVASNLKNHTKLLEQMRISSQNGPVVQVEFDTELKKSCYIEDLFVEDQTTTSKLTTTCKILSNTECSFCEKKIDEDKYLCTVCKNYGLCTVCFFSGHYNHNHKVYHPSLCVKPASTLKTNEELQSETRIEKLATKHKYEWHTWKKCDGGCGQQTISGLRIKCQECVKYNMCYKCWLKKEHTSHAMKIVTLNESNSESSGYENSGDEENDSSMSDDGSPDENSGVIFMGYGKQKDVHIF